jgi:hypothetical protein
MKKGKFIVDLQGVEFPDELHNEIEARINDVVLGVIAKFPNPVKDRTSILVSGRSPEWLGIWIRNFKGFDDFGKNSPNIKAGISKG